MYRFVLGAAIAWMGCNQTDNNRPATLPYITEAILQPSCGQYDCHSSFRREKGYAFDTVAAARASLLQPGLVNLSPGEEQNSLLYRVLTRNYRRMPYDSPLPDKDIALILQWIQDGAQGLNEP
ncbi:MAG TPA: hypothetical protein VHN14_34685 [Kofleriaceae bacterium]|jgi:hypothetical protein|nr:hypothetical protein [Kofleriaceae bacterium]